jgi:hypothetical protein
MVIELFAEAQIEIANPKKIDQPPTKLDCPPNFTPFEIFSKCSENSKTFLDYEEYFK